MKKVSFNTVVNVQNVDKSIRVEMTIFQEMFTTEQILKMCLDTIAKRIDVKNLSVGESIEFNPYTGNIFSAYEFDNVTRSLKLQSSCSKESTAQGIATVFITAI